GHPGRRRHDVAPALRAQHRLRQRVPELVRHPEAALARRPEHLARHPDLRRHLAVDAHGGAHPAGRPHGPVGGAAGGRPHGRRERLAALLVRDRSAHAPRHHRRGAAARDRRAQDLRHPLRHQGKGRGSVPRRGDAQRLRLRAELRLQRVRPRIRCAHPVLPDDPRDHLDHPDAEKGHVVTALAEGRVSAPARRRRRPFRWGPVGRFVGLAVIIVMFLGPIVWMVLASFKLNVQIYDSSQAIIFEPTLENYGTVFDPRRGNYLVYIWNSFFIAFMATGLSLVLAVPAAYAMSRFLMNKSATTVLLARIIPGVSLLVPWYYIFAQLRMTGSFLPLILSHMFVSLPLILYIMMSFFDQMPEELEESAQVDG